MAIFLLAKWAIEAIGKVQVKGPALAAKAAEWDAEKKGIGGTR